MFYHRGEVVSVLELRQCALRVLAHMAAWCSEPTIQLNMLENLCEKHDSKKAVSMYEGIVLKAAQEANIDVRCGVL